MSWRFFQDPVPDMSIAITRAEAGARYLDEVRGENWHQRINLESLNISSPFNCILGQFLRQGHLGMAFISLPEAVAHGFSCGLWDFLFFAQPPWLSRSFDRLTEAWKMLIRDRAIRDQLPKPKLARETSADHDRNDSGQNNCMCVS